MKRHALVAVAALAAACGQPAAPGPADLAIGPPVDIRAESLDLNIIPAATMAVISSAATSGTGGALNAVRLADRALTKAIDGTLDADNQVRCVGGSCYVLDRVQRTLRIYDPNKDWKNPVKFLLEAPAGDGGMAIAGDDPRDVHPIPASTKIYVTFGKGDAAHALGILDVTRPAAGVVGWIALAPSTADTDGKPEPGAVHLCGAFLAVLARDLDGAGAPTGPGRLFTVDTTSDAPGAPVALAGKHPLAFATDGPACDVVLIATSDGIERVDLSMRRSLGLAVKDTSLGGRPSTIATVSRQLAYATVVVGSTAKVVALNPATGNILGDATAPAGAIAFAHVTPTTQLLVGVTLGDTGQGQLAPGLYLGPADGTKLTASPIDLTQIPVAATSY